MKKVLVCSIPCWSKKVGSDTFSSLMEGYDKNCLANLYIRDGMPDSPVCNNYFKISENAVIRSVFKRKIKTGQHIFLDATSESTEEPKSVADRLRTGNSVKRYLLLFAREILWKLGCWRSKELDAFLEEFQPETVFFAMEGYIHFNRINRYIMKKTGAKGVGYFWDDNFTYRQSNEFLYKVYRFFQRRDLKKTAKLCNEFFAISPKTKEEADRFFHIDCKLLTKPIDFSDAKYEKTEPQLPLKLLYTGKLIIGRFDTVKMIGEALDDLNKDGFLAELDIYTTTTLEESQKASLSPYVHILGAIPQTEVARVQKEADVLLFAEAVEGKNSKIARLSFSTKLTDYFRSGKCILAVGAADTAPMEYLKNEGVALIASTKLETRDALRRITQSPELIEEYGYKAFLCGQKNHDKKQIQETLFHTLNQ